MELRHLRYFIAVADEENVSRAAAKLHVSQPGISRQIRDLEDEIGFRLFERSAKSLKLTAAGKTFLIEARAVLQRADDAVKNARAVAGGAGELHVGYAPSLTVKILPQALRVFQEKYPEVRVSLHDLSTEEMLSKLREGKLHLALTVQPKAKFLRDLAFKTLAQYSTCVALAPKHPLAKSRSVTLAQLVHEPLIGYSRIDYPDYHEYIARVFGALAHGHRAPRVAEEHDGITSIITAVASGRGYALVPEPTICMAGPRVKILPLKPDGEKICVGAIWKKGAVLPLIEKFVAAAGEE